jgi:putative membrane protein
MKNYIFLFLKGLAMGAVNKIPGVSGGTVAFITGIYEDLINSIKKINFKSFKILFSRGFKDFYFEINGRFLTIVFSGVIASFFSVSLILDRLIEEYELYVFGLFFGMIIGSFYVIYYQLERLSLKTLIGILVGLASGLLISFADNFEVTNSNLIIFISGMIAISGMILPGLSGSYLLLLMGNYTLIMVDSVNALYFTITEIFSFNFDFLNDPDRIYLLKILFFFTIGSVSGLIFLSNILSTLLKNYKSLTIAVIVGFIAGSLRGVWPWKSEGVDGKISLFFPNFSLGETHLTLVYIFIGILFVVLLERFANKN